MVIARGEGGDICALVAGDGTRTAPSKINQAASFIKKTPSWEIGPKQTAECTTSLGGGRRRRKNPRDFPFGRAEDRLVSTDYGCEKRKNLARMHFSLACRDEPCILRVRIRFTAAARVAFAQGGRE